MSKKRSGEDAVSTQVSALQWRRGGVTPSVQDRLKAVREDAEKRKAIAEKIGAVPRSSRPRG